MPLVSLADIQTYLGISSPTAAVTALLTLVQERADELVREYVGYRIGPYATEADVPSHREYLPDRAQPRSGADDLTQWDEALGEAADLQRIFTREIPVRSITTIHENAEAGGIEANWTSDDLLTADDDYYLDDPGNGLSKTGVIYRRGSWPAAQRSVRVVYKAGYLTSELANTNFPKASLIATVAAWRQALAMQGSRTSTGALIGQGFGPVARDQIGQLSIYYDAPTVREVAGMINELPREVKKLLQRYRRWDL